MAPGDSARVNGATAGMGPWRKKWPGHVASSVRLSSLVRLGSLARGRSVDHLLALALIADSLRHGQLALVA